MEAETSEEFRVFLQNELEARIKKNSRYSMRAFAKALDMDSSLLSKILNSKRALSFSMTEHLISRLNLPPGKAARFTSKFRQPQAVQRHFESGVFKGEGTATKSQIGPFAYDLVLTIEDNDRITRLQTLKDGTVISDTEWQIVYPTHGPSFHFVDKHGVVIGNGMVGDDRHCRYSFMHQDPDQGGRDVFVEEDVIRDGDRWERSGRVFKPGCGRETLEEWTEVLMKIK